MMGKSLQRWNLFVILAVAGGQIVIAEAALAQDVDEEASWVVGQPSLVIGHSSLDQFQTRMLHNQRQLTNDQPATTVAEWMAQIDASRTQVIGAAWRILRRVCRWY